MFIKLIFIFLISLPAYGSALIDPTQPHHYVQKESRPAIHKTSSLTLNMILHKGNIPYAIINNKMLGQGDVIENAKVITISAEQVILKRQGQRITLKVLNHNQKMNVTRH